MCVIRFCVTYIFIEILFCFSFVYWVNGFSVKYKNNLNNKVKVCAKTFGIKQDLDTIWEKQVAEKTKTIIGQTDHILLTKFPLMHLGRHNNCALKKNKLLLHPFCY